MIKKTGAKVRISEKKTKFYLSFLEREYLRRSQSYKYFWNYNNMNKKIINNHCYIKNI